MEKKKIKEKTKERAITLIALTITVIVLLILAGVTITTLTGNNGILTKSQEARTTTEIEEAKEQAKIDISNWILEKSENGESTNLNDSIIKEILTDKEYVKGTPGESSFITKKGEHEISYSELYKNELEFLAGKYYAIDTNITIGEKTITIPAGATISKIPGENDVDEGLVIYITNEEVKEEEWNNRETMQEIYNQFVWVPVENPVLDLTPDDGTSLPKEDSDTIKAKVQNEIDAGRYPMAIKNGEDYIGVLYQFTEDNDKVKVELYENWAPLSGSYEEPDIVRLYDEDISNLNQINEILNTNYSSSTDFKNDLQTKFNAMVKSVAEKGGFWVGRYETSNMINSNSAAQKINVVKGTMTGINNVTWYRMYSQQEIYSQQALQKSENIKSTMMWGSQWNQILIWMRNIRNEEKDSYYVTNSLGMGNFGTNDDTESGIVNTGFYEAKNIYDLAGNLNEWTLEVNDTFNRTKCRWSLL